MTSRLEYQAKSPIRLFYARYRNPGLLAELSDDFNLTTLHNSSLFALPPLLPLLRCHDFRPRAIVNALGACELL